jgi:beta-lactamase class A
MIRDSRSTRPLTRREMMAAAVSASLCGCSVALLPTDSATDQLSAIHSRAGGRLGVHALDTQTGRRIGFDDESRFAMASTFKLPLVAAVLSRIDAGEISIDQPISFGEQDMLSYAPVTSKHLRNGAISVRTLCAAAVEVSDNVAANLLLRLIGGPTGLTRFLRDLGDDITRLDRVEPALNSNEPGDVRDTTSAIAMVNTMNALLVEPMLSAQSRTMLIGWLVSSTTGLQRIRAGLPSDWTAGDKTGTGGNGAVNDIAVLYPPNRNPILISIYMSGSALDSTVLSALHAEIAGTVVRFILVPA